jgi:hypothetical protein
MIITRIPPHKSGMEYAAVRFTVALLGAIVGVTVTIELETLIGIISFSSSLFHGILFHDVMSETANLGYTSTSAF